MENDIHFPNLRLNLTREMESENGVLTEIAQTENVEVRLSPVQIQQEYYENLPDCDWVK